MAMTAKDLLAQKTTLLKRTNQEVDVEIKDLGVWTFYTPSLDDINDANVYADEHYGGVAAKVDLALVYQMCKSPQLYDPELVKALASETGEKEVAGPWIVEKILKAGEVARIASLLMKKAGFNDTDISEYKSPVEIGADAVKNS